jgi:plasmid stabilization system protein ParE
VAEIIYAPNALANLERAFEFLAQQNPKTALAAARAIRSAVEAFADHPLIGRCVEGDLRELMISYGRTGYVALYRFVPARNQVRILAVRQQIELGYPD